ncbi:unnamed protein product [Closterium sp. NIES-65]|nr:unnamed protein product [Closterium sp. NIES-65]
MSRSPGMASPGGYSSGNPSGINSPSVHSGVKRLSAEDRQRLANMLRALQLQQQAHAEAPAPASAEASAGASRPAEGGAERPAEAGAERGADMAVDAPACAQGGERERQGRDMGGANGEAAGMWGESPSSPSSPPPGGAMSRKDILEIVRKHSGALVCGQRRHGTGREREAAQTALMMDRQYWREMADLFYCARRAAEGGPQPKTVLSGMLAQTALMMDRLYWREMADLFFVRGVQLRVMPLKMGRSGTWCSLSETRWVGEREVRHLWDDIVPWLLPWSLPLTRPSHSPVPPTHPSLPLTRPSHSPVPPLTRPSHSPVPPPHPSLPLTGPSHSPSPPTHHRSHSPIAPTHPTLPLNQPSHHPSLPPPPATMCSRLQQHPVRQMGAGGDSGRKWGEHRLAAHLLSNLICHTDYSLTSLSAVHGPGEPEAVGRAQDPEVTEAFPNICFAIDSSDRAPQCPTHRQQDPEVTEAYPNICFAIDSSDRAFESVGQRPRFFVLLSAHRGAAFPAQDTVLKGSDHCFCVLLSAHRGAAFPAQDTVEKTLADGQRRVLQRGTSSEAKVLGEASGDGPKVRRGGVGRGVRRWTQGEEGWGWERRQAMDPRGLDEEVRGLGTAVRGAIEGMLQRGTSSEAKVLGEASSGNGPKVWGGWGLDERAGGEASGNGPKVCWVGDGERLGRWITLFSGFVSYPMLKTSFQAGLFSMWGSASPSPMKPAGLPGWFSVARGAKEPPTLQSAPSPFLHFPPSRHSPLGPRSPPNPLSPPGTPLGPTRLGPPTLLTLSRPLGSNSHHPSSLFPPRPAPNMLLPPSPPPPIPTPPHRNSHLPTLPSCLQPALPQPSPTSPLHPNRPQPPNCPPKSNHSPSQNNPSASGRPSSVPVQSGRPSRPLHRRMPSLQELQSKLWAVQAELMDLLDTHLPAANPLRPSPSKASQGGGTEAAAAGATGGAAASAGAAADAAVSEQGQAPATPLITTTGSGPLHPDPCRPHGGKPEGLVPLVLAVLGVLVVLIALV